MKLTRLIFCILVAACVFLTGCLFVLHPINETFARHSNPIEGWKSVGKVGYEVGEMSAEISPIPGYEAISNDVQKFVNKLPVDHLSAGSGGGTRRWCYWIDEMTFFEDGTGQHAVSFNISHHGTDYEYVLIYDKNNERVKAVRYVKGYYMS